MSDLTGKVALVTGGSGGIGRAIAIALAEAGAQVAVGYHKNEDEALETATRCGPGAWVLQADVSVPAQAEQLVQRAAARHGRLDLLVNNAGVALYKLLIDTTPLEWARLIGVHLTGTYACTRAALPYMLQAGWGRILTIGSIWGEVGGAGEVAYSTAKAGLMGFTRALAKEVGRSGITVNCIAPGATETRMLSGFAEAELAELADEAPVGRLGQPADVAAVARFLCSDAAAYITGQVLNVNGGLH